MKSVTLAVHSGMQLGCALLLIVTNRLAGQSVMADVNQDGVVDEIYQAQTVSFTPSIGSVSGSCAPYYPKRCS